MKRSEETMAGICDTIASGIMSYAQACKLNSVAPRTFWGWIKASQGGDEAYLVDYLGERIQFARAINAARRMALHEMRGRMEMKSILGWDEPIYFQGMPTFKPDLRCVGWSEIDREKFGFRRDGLLEVAGKVVQNSLHHQPSDALTLRVAAMAFSEYRETTNTNVNLQGNVTLRGVGVSSNKPASYDGPAPEVPPPPPLPQLTMVGDSDDPAIPETITDATADEPESDVTNTPATAYIDEDYSLPPAAPVPEPIERVIREPTPQEYAPGPNPLVTPRNGRPLSDLEKSLLSKLPPNAVRS